MKRVLIAIVCFWLFGAMNVFAQSSETQVKITHKVQPLPIGIAYNQTTNLIFPYAIKSIDKGSKDVLVQKAKGVENVLQLKAGKDSFDLTNLTVITSEGQLFAFDVYYDPHPKNLNIELGVNQYRAGSEVIFSERDDNEAKRNDAAEQVALKLPTYPHFSVRSFGVQLRLLGLYVKNDQIYYQLGLENNSNINYDIDQIRFFIKDKKKSRRTASQEIELAPEFSTGNKTIIRRTSRQTVVFVLPKLTIPDKKYLIIEMKEANGGRHLSLKVQNKDLMEARVI